MRMAFSERAALTNMAKAMGVSEAEVVRAALAEMRAKTSPPPPARGALPHPAIPGAPPRGPRPQP